MSSVGIESALSPAPWDILRTAHPSPAACLKVYAIFYLCLVFANVCAVLNLCLRAYNGIVSRRGIQKFSCIGQLIETQILSAHLCSYKINLIILLSAPIYLSIYLPMAVQPLWTLDGE
jgi:hypothetical protein